MKAMKPWSDMSEKKFEEAMKRLENIEEGLRGDLFWRNRQEFKEGMNCSNSALRNWRKRNRR
jgi:hypothetical protein